MPAQRPSNGSQTPHRLTTTDTAKLAGLATGPVRWELRRSAPILLQEGINWDHPIVNSLHFTVLLPYRYQVSLSIFDLWTVTKFESKVFWVGKDPRHGTYLMSSPDFIYRTYKTERRAMGPISADYHVIDKTFTSSPDRFKSLESAVDAGVEKVLWKHNEKFKERALPLSYRRFTPAPRPQRTDPVRRVAASRPVTERRQSDRPRPKREDCSPKVSNGRIARCVVKIATLLLIGMVAAGFLLRAMCRDAGGSACWAVAVNGDLNNGLGPFFTYLGCLTFAVIALVCLVTKGLRLSTNAFEGATTWLSWSSAAGVGVFFFVMSRAPDEPVGWSVWLWLPGFLIGGFVTGAGLHARSTVQ